MTTLGISCQNEANQCDLTTEKGLKCRKCRLMRCLEVGQMEKVQIFGLYESILMNFVEAVAETDIPPFLNVAFQVLCV